MEVEAQEHRLGKCRPAPWGSPPIRFYTKDKPGGILHLETPMLRICATCTHSQGFPTEEEMPDPAYPSYQNLPGGKCAFMPPVPLVVPRTVNTLGVQYEIQNLESVFPAVEATCFCGQWGA